MLIYQNAEGVHAKRKGGNPCARKSVKISSDLEDSKRSDGLRKRYLYIWNFWEKCEVL